MATSAKYPAEISSHYVVKDTIGTGGFAKVKVARHRMTGEKVAIKVMDKAHLAKTDDLKRVALEIKALKELRHQNISQLYQVVETKDKYFLVLEYAPGGELFDYIVSRDRCKEEEARQFFRQIIKAVHHCHESGYVHRDLKPENLLLDNQHNLKLIDFGLVAHPTSISKDLLRTCCGSAAYAAPELIRGERYSGPPADMWSLGILLYALLCGFLPFDDENTQKLYRQVQKGEYEIPRWMSKGSQDFIAQLLKHKPSERLTMEQVLRHPWVLQGLEEDRLDPSSTLDSLDKALDTAVITELAKYYNIATENMQDIVKERLYDHHTADYELCLLRTRKGHTIRLPANKGKLDADKAMQLLKTHERRSSDGLRPEARMFGSSLALSGSGEDLQFGVAAGPYMHPPGSVENLARAAMTNAALSSMNPAAVRKQKQKAKARPRGLTVTLVDAKPVSGSMYDLNQASSSDSEMKRHSSNPALSPMKAKAPPLEAASDIPEPRPLQAKDRNGASGSRGSFGNLVRSFTNLFMGSSQRLNEPRVVKGVFNVNTTSSKDREEVYQEMLRACEVHGFTVKEKGFVVKAKSPDDKISLNIELCKLHQMDQMDLVGIRFKRLKGDTWSFKEVCKRLTDEMRL
eukprot:TRINITY_DN10117_c0_g1_i1.p1 TRINITY_DN10117_c0_g1~~TRINITY_DN10117_c0_g1_i1.p1  ORF type:complete len:630 (+),score=160.06 TRINITY_DN10117_c0_g1_i1:116-2005(+)